MSTIENGENLGSVRAKLNAGIASASADAAAASASATAAAASEASAAASEATATAQASSSATAAAAAEASRLGAVEAQTAAEASRLGAVEAQTAAELAAESIPVSVSDFAELATLTSDDVAVGDYVRVIGIGATYVRAADAATDVISTLDHSGSGGVKLYPTRTDAGWNLTHLGGNDADRWTGASELVALSSWVSGFRVEPDAITGGGATFTLASNVTLPKGTRLERMNVVNTGATLTVGPGVGETAEISWLGDGFTMQFTGTSDYAGAMVAMPAVSAGGAASSACLDGTSGTNHRARYCLYAGEEVAFGCDFLGAFTGGECGLRVGYDRDQTSNRIMPRIADRSSVVNVLLCNPIGNTIIPNIEHCEGAVALAITSETNGSATIAQSIDIYGGYMFNNGVTQASSDGIVGISIGKDVPGTEGWDQAGVITSGSNAQAITIRNVYAASNNIETFVDVNALFGITLDGIIWGGTPTGSNPQRLASFSGACSQTRVRNCRNQTSGATTPAITSTATNRILVDLPGGDTFNPVVRGQVGTEGSFTYSARRGSWSVTDGVLTINAYAAWTAASGGAGAVEITLPSLAVPISGARCTAAIKSNGFAHPVEGIIFSGENTLKLFRENSSVRIGFADVPASGDLHFSVSVPVTVVP